MFSAVSIRVQAERLETSRVKQVPAGGFVAKFWVPLG